MERCFIRELVRKVEFGCIENGQPNPSAIEGAVNAVNVVFGTRLCPDVGRSRIPRPKIVLINEALWDVIERENPFARAYRWDTEPAWDELKIIFGQPKNEPIHNSDDEVYADPSRIETRLWMKFPQIIGVGSADLEYFEVVFKPIFRNA
ncbi:hypothetical protein Salat_1094500 [Sesamum alatum]|uniref:Uncharacterized protein n=1 Tax=Sesamum alatum TaxID=300844 RepID=A0AAE2CSX2_9LAMI|nr:hypothetical protein Salat_1094500 [Sesamum alatum]